MPTDTTILSAGPFHPLAFVSFAVSLFHLFLLGFIAGQRKKDPLNRFYFLFALCIFLVTLFDFLIRLPVSEPAFTVAIKAGTFVFLVATWFYLLVCYQLVSRPADTFLKFTGFLSFSIAAVSVFLPPVVSLRQNQVSVHAFIFLPVYAAVILPALVGLVLTARRMLAGRTRSVLPSAPLEDPESQNRRQIQINLFFFGSVSSQTVGLILILASSFSTRLSFLSYFFSLSMLIQAVFVFLAVARYYFLSVDQNEAVRTVAGIFRDISDGFVLIDARNKIVQTNQTASAILGLTPGSDSSLIAERIPGYSSGRDYHFERHVVSDPTGHERVLLISQDPIRHSLFHGKILFIRDITEQNALEEELHRTRQVESLGWLAGGIAHDFNNYLTGVLTSLSVLKMETLSPIGKDILEASEKASFRAAELIQQLMTFSRGDAPVRENLSLRELIDETASFVLRGTDCSLSVDCPDNLPPISADKKLINRVFHNLIVNSLQAVPSQARLSITARSTIVVEDSFLPVAPGQYIHIRFQDNGPGIPEANLNRVFEPYFTTKQTGKGLGLTIVHSVIKRHGGHIKAGNIPSGGAVFDFYLPAGERMPDSRDDSTDERLPVQSSRILIMEDRKDVSTPLKLLLERWGNSVETSPEGSSALELVRTRIGEGRPFHVAIIDILIPGGMGGIEFNEKIKQISPATRTILYTGHSDVERPSSDRFDAFLAKPFKPSRLRRILHDLLSPTTLLNLR
jgi:PAS domain S-box-containing protein